MKTVYYINNGPENQPGFRGGGSAWWVRTDPDRPWDEHFGEFRISEQLYKALFHLDIVDDFYELPIHGILGAYEEGILKASGLGKASQILWQRAENLAEETYEWTCGKQLSLDEVEYKIRVDAAALKEELLALAAFLEGGESQRFDVQLWL